MHPRVTAFRTPVTAMARDTIADAIIATAIIGNALFLCPYAFR
jgi:hypothetical protein